MNHSQKNWVQLLSMTQLVLNNRTATVIGESVFFANFGHHFNLFNISRNSSQMKIVLQEASQLRNIYKKILKNIEYQ